MQQRSSPLRRGAAFLAIALWLAGSPASAGEDPSLVREGSIGAACALISMAYGPIKMVYALSGMVLAGSSFLWTWGNRDVAMKVARMSLGGDYVITPAHLRGADEIRFTGE
jgi:hypothetical protein